MVDDTTNTILGTENASSNQTECFVLVKEGKPTELLLGQSFEVDDLQHPGSIIFKWDAEELKDIGVYPAVRDAPDVDAAVGRVVEAPVDEWHFSDGVFNAVYSVIPLSPEEIKIVLAEERERAKRTVDNNAERERLKYITPGVGQSAVYTAKVQELIEYKQDSNPNEENYPLLSASIGIDGDSLADVVEKLDAIQSGWKQIAKQIEHKRLNAKRQIDNALTVSEIHKAKSVMW